jgi:hypothetical protein
VESAWGVARQGGRGSAFSFCLIRTGQERQREVGSAFWLEKKRYSSTITCLSGLGFFSPGFLFSPTVAMLYLKRQQTLMNMRPAYAEKTEVE